MNKRTFLKSCLATLALVSLPITFKKTYPKYGSINIRHLPDGTRMRDWRVIDEATGESPRPSEAQEDDIFLIRSASDNETSGYCVGILYNQKPQALYRGSNLRVLRGNYRIEYLGKIAKYHNV